MSTEYYIQGYKDEQPDGIAVADVLAAFGKREGDHDNGFYRLRYDENAHCDASLTVRDGGREVVGFCFTPQDGNSLLSSVAATSWFMDPKGYDERVQCLRPYFFDEV